MDFFYIDHPAPDIVNVPFGNIDHLAAGDEFGDDLDQFINGGLNAGAYIKYISISHRMYGGQYSGIDSVGDKGIIPCLLPVPENGQRLIGK